jgi:phosphopantetheinyl transferase (holo-ACP synthase)
MIFGVGTDILELSRVQETYNRFGDHFVDRLLMEEEREQYRHNKWPVRFLAMRFAAKEATVKAMAKRWEPGFDMAYGSVMLASSTMTGAARKSSGPPVDRVSVTSWASAAVTYP